MPRKKKTETAPVAEVKAEVVTEAVKETAAKKAPAKIEAAFSLLEEQGQLKQGNGLFEFGDFSIHI